jgi:hypothetical protein
MVSFTDITEENTNKTSDTTQSHEESLPPTFHYDTGSTQTTLTTYYPAQLRPDHLVEYYLDTSLGTRYDFIMDPLRAPDPVDQIMGIYDHPDIVVDVAPAGRAAVETPIAPAEMAAVETALETQPDDKAPNASTNGRSSKRRRKTTPQAEPVSNIQSRQHYTNPADQSDEELGQLGRTARNTQFNQRLTEHSDEERVETTTTPKKHGQFKDGKYCATPSRNAFRRAQRAIQRGNEPRRADLLALTGRDAVKIRSLRYHSQQNGDRTDDEDEDDEDHGADQQNQIDTLHAENATKANQITAQANQITAQANQITAQANQLIAQTAQSTKFAQWIKNTHSNLQSYTTIHASRPNTFVQYVENFNANHADIIDEVNALLPPSSFRPLIIKDN